MPRFAGFKTASQAGVPAILQAEISRANTANQVAQYENDMRRRNIAGGIEAYNAWQGDNTPIGDAFGRGKDALVGALRSPSGQEQAGEIGMNSGVGMDGDFESGMMPQINSGSYLDSGADAAPAMGDMGAASMDSTMSGVGESALPTMDAAADIGGGADALSSGANAAGGASDAAGGVPLVSALRGVDQLAQGDVGGAAGTGAKAYLSTMGPWGAAAAAVLSVLGI